MACFTRLAGGASAVMFAFGALLTNAWGAAPEVRLEGGPGQWRLLRDGRPYVILGVGGDRDWERLAQLGGNSVRTWGHESLGAQLDRAHALGLTVTAGIWLGQVRQGFDWTDAAGLIRQREIVREAVRRHKDHPALLMWALGNEMEDPEGKNGAVWSEINSLARLVKTLDGRHPVMTVVAELGGEKVRNLHALCPEVDILGINSYAGAESVGTRYQTLGGTKPYLLTEFGPPGIWEQKPDEIGAYREPTSTEKVAWYRRAYQANVVDRVGSCLGSYAFLWGHKQEVTATWFSLLLPDGSRLGAVDALSELWTGKPVANRCPTIEALTLEEAKSNKLPPGEKVTVTLRAGDPERDPLRVTWSLVADHETYGTGGDAESAAPELAGAIVTQDATRAELKLPREGGLYRVFATVRDGQGGAAVANLPLRVDAPEPLATGLKVTLPFVLYDEADTPANYAPSGWMGATKELELDPLDKSRPHHGATALRCGFKATTGWGGIAWQHPPQDWGDQRGGFDLSAAKRLAFQARGAEGGEVVSFGVGLIGRDKPHFDTTKRTLDQVVLTRDWRRYEIPLDQLPAGESLQRIKTGFVWTVAAGSKPIVFYLDEIRYE
jgi:hypothetical protein